MATNPATPSAALVDALNALDDANIYYDLHNGMVILDDGYILRGVHGRWTLHRRGGAY